MEVGEVVDLPVQLDAFGGGLHGRAGGGEGAGAEDDHVETAGGRVVDPFRGEGADAVEGSEIDSLGGEQVVVRLRADVVDVLDDEGVGEGVLGE